MNNKIKSIILKSFKNDNRIFSNPSAYFYDLSIITQNIDNIEKYALPNISLYYSMKANPNLILLEHIMNHEFIKGIEIASLGELEKASKVCNRNQILFTGPGKTEKELKKAIESNIRFINVESLVEAIRINNIANEKVDVLLRINIDYYIDEADEYMAGISTKMGIDECDFYKEYEMISKLNNINICGIHVFSASGVLNYKGLINYSKYVFDLVKEIEKKIKLNIDVIDFGGGIGIDYTKEGKNFDFLSYFKALKELIDKYNYYSKEIIMELGKFIVGMSGYYATKIIDIKDIKSKKHIVTAGGVNHMRLPIATGRKHSVYVINLYEKLFYETQPYVKNEMVDIEGPLCMNEDKISWDEYIEFAQIGDIIILAQAGAYCYSASTLEFLSHEYPLEIII